MPDIRNNIITVYTKPEYNIYIDRNNCYSNFFIHEISNIKQRGIERFIVIADSNIAGYFSELSDFIISNINISLDFITISIDESLKTRDTKNKIEDRLFELGANRYTALIAIGGGVLLDMVGFIAATFNRGIPVIYIPTTLLAMVDASVGGKTGLNTQHGKNLIGVFKQPDAVFIDINVLTSLSHHDYLAALAEIIKLAIIFDSELFDFLNNNHINILSRDFDSINYLINTGVKLKSKIVEQDEKESNLRQLLNFGHTFGHAIEKNEDYQISHGYAVALGLWLEVFLANKINILSNRDYQKIQNLLLLYYKGKIPMANKNTDCNILYQCLLHDKKTKNKMPHFVIVNKIGGFYNNDELYSHPVDYDTIIDILSLYNINCPLFSDGLLYE